MPLRALRLSGAATVGCLLILVVDRLQILNIAGTPNARLWTCFNWGLAYDAALAFFFGATVLLISRLSARYAPLLSAVLLANLQLFHLVNIVFYRFFGFHLDVRFHEYMSAENTINIRASIEKLVRVPDLVFGVLLPIAVIVVMYRILARNVSREGRPALASRVAGVACLGAVVLIGVGFNYVGNIEPGPVLHDPSGLGAAPLFSFLQSATKLKLHQRDLDNTQELPQKILSQFRRSYNLSHRWKSESDAFPWMREPIKPTAEHHHKRKNVVFVFLESFGAMSTNPLSPVFKHVTPEFARLSRQGVLFTHAYFNTNPTAPAESSTLCSVYSAGTILYDFATKLDCAGDIFQKHGFFTTFIGGNKLNYDNQLDFWQAHGFKTIIDDGSFWFPPTRPDTKDHWGRYVDADVFKQAIQWMDTTENKDWPFFLVVKTASSHAPYADMGEPFRSTEGVDENQRRMNGSMMYVDHELGRFIDELSKRPYFKNTIFFIFGDHSPNELQQWPGGADYNSFVAHAQIPFLILNPEGLKPGTRFDGVVSQVDFLPTALDMLDITEATSHVGHSIIDPTIRPEDRYAFVYDRARGRRGLITSRYAYFHDYRLHISSLSKLSHDPYSRMDISAHSVKLANDFKNWLDAFNFTRDWSFEHDRVMARKEEPAPPVSGVAKPSR